MAEEINFIRPQEVYDRNTGESKVRYRSYDGNDRFIPVVNGEKGVPKTMVEVTHAELKAMRDGGKLTAGALYRITDYNCTTTQENTKSAGHQFDIVLLALSENKLAEEGWAMEHLTDVYDVTFSDGVTKKCYLYFFDDDSDCNVVLAEDITKGQNLGMGSEDFPKIDKINKTAELGWSYYDDEHGDGFITIAEPNVQYNYFQNSNLSAWKVWYCLDNDKSRFAWADTKIIYNVKVKQESFTQGQWKDAIIVYKGEKNNTDAGILYKFVMRLSEQSDDEYVAIYLTTENLYDLVGTKFDLYNGSGRVMISNCEIQVISKDINGRGIIYRLIDEFNNDIKYDFKNIQFKRKLTNGSYATNGTDTWCYTLNIWYNDMCQDASIIGNTLPNDEGFVNGVYDNKFGYATAKDLYLEGVSTFAFALGDNVVLSLVHEDGYFGIFSNKIGDGFKNNTFGNYFTSNTIGNYCQNNIHIDQFNSNMIGDGFNGNKINTFFMHNIIANEFVHNTINKNFVSNMVGNNFNSKTISDNTSSKNYGNNGVELATKS